MMQAVLLMHKIYVFYLFSMYSFFLLIWGISLAEHGVCDQDALPYLYAALFL